ncbi:noggin 4 S homeolog precursor [Xenopus laevis]|uniref:Noggin n=1 Tax=Xenopus laevis TaxID=8355 RepID=Q2NNB0_XENLA|nr:noggin 4 S homeolog precursor [Xenopus laevis]AAX07472.1 noggin4 [Xenopus laevis]
MAHILFLSWLVTLGTWGLTAICGQTNDLQHYNQTQKDMDIGSLRRRLSSGTRPYSLSLSPQDYHYSPKPKHLRVSRLLRLLGSSFDPFWMSVEQPADNGTSLLSTLSQDIYDGASRYRKKLSQEAQALDFDSLQLPTELSANSSQHIQNEIRQWLVQRASCHLTSSWVDLGTVFWPRWVRHTDCDGANTVCSWPPGMACRQAQLTQIKLLAWHCWMKDTGLGWATQQCTWRQVPYPVVAACKCTCK